MKRVIVPLVLLLLLIGCAQSQTGSSQQPQASYTPDNSPDAQKVSVRALDTGLYDNAQITVKAGQPVEFIFSADKGSGCGRQLLIPAFNVNMVSKDGEPHTATFTPQKPGTYEYHCGMKMFRGKLVVTN